MIIDSAWIKQCIWYRECVIVWTSSIGPMASQAMHIIPYLFERINPPVCTLLFVVGLRRKTVCNKVKLYAIQFLMFNKYQSSSGIGVWWWFSGWNWVAWRWNLRLLTLSNWEHAFNHQLAWRLMQLWEWSPRNRSWPCNKYDHWWFRLRHEPLTPDPIAERASFHMGIISPLFAWTSHMRICESPFCVCWGWLCG